MKHRAVRIGFLLHAHVVLAAPAALDRRCTLRLKRVVPDQPADDAALVELIAEVVGLRDHTGHLE
jgi:hypothetical protein